MEQLGTATVLEPWLQKIRQANIPLFTIDTASPSSINDTTSDNFFIGEQLALKLVNDIHGEGNILVRRHLRERHENRVGRGWIGRYCRRRRA